MCWWRCCWNTCVEFFILFIYVFFFSTSIDSSIIVLKISLPPSSHVVFFLVRYAAIINKLKSIRCHLLCRSSSPHSKQVSKLQQNTPVGFAMFLCKWNVFPLLCKCRHLWIEICGCETCVATSLWTPGFEAPPSEDVSPEALRHQNALVCVSWCSRVAVMVTIKAITGGPRGHRAVAPALLHRRARS